ncbi:hypothetical protein F5887DRAFT_1069706 [Amanita rubescens]|nr:hypothetical protein F5887DRAFT_1069706 [Amanita rubescens]
MLSIFASPRIIKHAAHVLGRTPFLGSLLDLSVGHPRTSILHGLTNHVRLISDYSKVNAMDSNIVWERMSKEVSRWENVPPDPYSGRSVSASRDLASAFRKLDSILSRNKVRAQALQSERHEQKGAKRRRLSSERWRKRFAHEVRMKVQLVQKIRMRGA